MKLKLDFISNSSSTSFVYISDSDFTEEVFMKAVGVDPNGPVGDLFREMHWEILSGLQSGETIATSDQADSLANRHEFTPDVIEKMKEAIDQGNSVYTGSLSSDGKLAESLLCMEMFEIKSDEFYINAFNNYW
ncbi:hypothetical protein [uncultured Roseibium sp.]|uniref:hypothetical protein n=1 Tax=uncultured Roseibium sp. TaxID=1936171 RepID=UPI00262E4500|nr:hypothetical protein [uncultured Roseibium sp.]